MRIAEYLAGAKPMFELAVPAGSGSGSRCLSVRARPAGTYALADAYRASGGVIDCDDLASLMGRRREQPISLLARRIVERRVVHFRCDGRLLLPWFQLELPSFNVLPAVAEAIAELGVSFDDGQVAEWFAMPNCWLQGASPAGAIAAQSAAVIQASRADRFALLG
ncbi:hypothetical protein [Variovorax sp. JS1663]|uniref:hypothetical protein n=1 Tax=Variovorax sp. JS1663 TaxID=1851577 RepID=UPI000B3458A9|nr:hypothetical protein [Variovorax sp. JS1663]OUL98085.1 hypothetical protein A8M77_33400 [Variovorax sp. JS1663]